MNRGKGGHLTGLAACLAVGILHASAQAEDISGRWRFETGRLQATDCVIAGEMTFRRTPDKTAWTCEFVSRETCNREPEDTWIDVKQTCEARASGDAISVLSNVSRILSAGPRRAGEPEYDISRYKADNFTVAPNRKGELVGEFHSIQRAAVRFWRIEDLVS
jgi:hypothetical protein